MGELGNVKVLPFSNHGGVDVINQGVTFGRSDLGLDGHKSF